MLGLDGTGPESFQDVIDFVNASGLHEVQVTIQTAFPGAPLYDRFKHDGRLLQDEAWELCTLFDVNFKPDRMTVAELETHFRDLVEALYSDEATSRRRHHYYQQLRGVVRSEHTRRVEE